MPSKKLTEKEKQQNKKLAQKEKQQNKNFDKIVNHYHSSTEKEKKDHQELFQPSKCRICGKEDPLTVFHICPKAKKAEFFKKMKSHVGRFEFEDLKLKY